jgi:Na+/melibiose symporter-like transporter
VLVEQRVAEPVLPLWVFRRRTLLTSSLVGVGVGAAVIGLTSYVPTYVQTVIGTGPLVAGFALATLTLGWPMSAAHSSKAYQRIGFRSTALIGSTVAVAGTILLVVFTAEPSVVLVGTACFVIGAGLGWVAAPTLILAQSTVGWAERGVVTANNLFSRSIGSAVGVALFGAIANSTLHDGGSINRASQHVFVGAVIVAVGMAVAVLAMPTRQADSDTNRDVNEVVSQAA